MNFCAIILLSCIFVPLNEIVSVSYKWRWKRASSLFLRQTYLSVGTDNCVKLCNGVEQKGVSTERIFIVLQQVSLLQEEGFIDVKVGVEYLEGTSKVRCKTGVVSWIILYIGYKYRPVEIRLSQNKSLVSETLLYSIFLPLAKVTL